MLDIFARLMGRSANYRKQAAELRARARIALTREAARELYDLADRYTRLAEQADRNESADVIFEPSRGKLNGK